MNPTFEAAFKKYSGVIEKAVNEKASHDQRRALFFEFLHDGFGLSAEQVELEKGLYGLKVRGFIDALYQDLVVEFKKNLDAERETGKTEIKKYISGLNAYGQYFGILSDGVAFEIYLPLNGDLKLIETVKLTNLDTDQAFIWLDKYFFSAHPVKPTADDLVARFGPLSPVFIASMSSLLERFAAVNDRQSVRVKIDEWGKLLARVYGTSVGDEDLFLRHTYLVILARLLVYLALFKRKPGQTDLDGLISGNAFKKLGLLNFAEEDFFAWLLESKILKESKNWLWNLVQYFSVYEVGGLTGDLLKELYQALVDPETRHNLGEFYTPDWLATLTLDKVGFKFPQSILDPACGSGTFLACAIDRVRSQKISGVELVNWVLSEMCGLDIHPVAVITSKATLVLSLAQDLTKMRKAIILPIYMADAIPKFEVTAEGSLLSIHTGAKEAILIPVETAKDPAKIDQILDSMVHFSKSDSPLKVVSKGFIKRIEKLGEHHFHWAWAGNLRVLRNYIAKGRDTIWAFIIKNQYRPLFLFQRRFDNVVGNPPWLAYKFVKEPLYQQQIRALTFEYGLLDKSDVRNFPHVDTSTLFFAYSADRYLEPGGRIGFVMPYSVITGSKVHANFKLMRFGDTKLSWDLIVDCKDVQPLFNVPTCVLICSKDKTEKEKKL